MLIKIIWNHKNAASFTSEAEFANTPFLLPPEIVMLLRIRGAVGMAVGRGGPSITLFGVGALAVGTERGMSTGVAVELWLFDISGVSPALGLVVLAADAGQQIEQEAEDVEGEDQGDDPLEDGGDVALVRPRGADEDSGERDLDQDERQLDPEADAQDAVLAVVDPQALVLGAEKHSGQDEACDEEQEEPVVQVRVVVRVEDGEQDQACGSRDREDDGQHREHFLRRRRVGHQSPLVPEPPLCHECQVERHGRDHATGDEEWFQSVRSHVGDVGDCLSGLHGWVDGMPNHFPSNEHGEEHGQPPESGY